jgi:hypothetical protein
MTKGHRAGCKRMTAGPDRPARTAAMARSVNLEFDRALAAHVESLGLSDFETRSNCEERQRIMLRRLTDAGIAPSLLQDLANCSVHHCAMETCVEACHFGTLNRRFAAMETGLPIIMAHPGPKYAVCLVHPLWERPVGQLAGVSIKAAAQWNYRRLTVPRQQRAARCCPSATLHIHVRTKPFHR